MEIVNKGGVEPEGWACVAGCIGVCLAGCASGLGWLATIFSSLGAASWVSW